MKFLPLSLAT